MIVPFAAGGLTDVIGRVLAERMAGIVGGNVVTLPVRRALSRSSNASFNGHPRRMDGRTGVQDFKPTRRAFRCDGPHECIALADIEVPLRGCQAHYHAIPRRNPLSRTAVK
jgi:hypothetical protein